MTPQQESRLRAYAELLIGYELANVIGVRDRDRVLLEHIVDALSCVTTGHIVPGTRLIDVGAGGGLPGIPLLISRFGLSGALLEATAKKARFLTTVVKELELGQVIVVNQRAELAARSAAYRDSFDVAVARAVAPLPLLVEYCAPFVRAGGVIIAMKGRPSEDELRQGVAAAEELNAILEAIHPVEFRPEMVQKARKLIVFRKTAPTPKRFPRRVGLARQKPLGSGR